MTSSGPGADLPKPLAAASEDEVMRGMFPPDGVPDLATPLGTAFLWWTALDDPRQTTELHALTHQPSAWGDYAWARDLLRDLSIKQHIELAGGGRVAYVGFIPDVRVPARTFGTFESDVRWLTLVDASRGWRVWGLSEELNHQPSPEQIGI